AYGELQFGGASFYSQGAPGTMGSAGAYGTSGSYGSSGQYGTSGTTYGGYYGGDGGRGGYGGDGGDGARGAAGSSGGGGSGGTVKLVGSVVSTSSTATINTYGPGSAEEGKAVIGKNAGSASLSVTGSTVNTTGSRSSNPYTGAQTPNILALTGGAEAFGLTSLTKNHSSFAAVRSNAPDGAIAALYRTEVGPSGYSTDFSGFDGATYINLLNAALYSPDMGLNVAGDVLKQGGWANESNFGGSGDVAINLASGQVYTTLVAETVDDNFHIGARLGSSSGTYYSATGNNVTDGSVLYLIAYASTNNTFTGPGTINEGDLVTFDLNLVVSDPHQWDSGSFAFSPGSPDAVPGAGATSFAVGNGVFLQVLNQSYTYLDDGVFSAAANGSAVAELVYDTANTQTVSVDLSRGITVLNVAPTITDVTDDLSVLDGYSFDFFADATDPGVLDLLAFEWDFDDDGFFDDFFGANGSWTYDDAGLYLVALQVSDGDGGFAYASFNVDVIPIPVPASLVLGIFGVALAAAASRLLRR
ncbi:MAG: PKD domain-containing protein, partial [Planctomycetota bacterium]